MDEIREKVRGFIAEFANPDEKDIQKFISDLSSQNPSLDSENFKKNLTKLVKNAKELAAYEKEYSLLEGGNAELAEVLKEAKTGQENLEDISDELKTAKKILKSAGKTRKKPAGDEAKKKSTTEDGGTVLTGQEKKPQESEEHAGKIEPGEEIEKTVKKKGKRKEEKPEAKPEKLPEEVESLMHHLDSDATKDVIKEKMTTEKQAAFLHLEEKLLSDVETGIKKLKYSTFEESNEPILARLKSYLTKETGDIDAYHQSLHGDLVTFEGMEGYKEIERYWVNEPYSFVVILFNPEKNSYLYYVAEPKLSDFEDLLLREIKDRLKDILLFEDVKKDEDKEKILTDKVKKVIKDYAIDITPLTLEKILYYTRRDFIKFGKIDPLMHDNGIEDVSANGFDIPIYLYHKKYTNVPTNIFFTEGELDSYVIRLAQRCGKHVSVAEPMVDATMPDGSRIQMTLGTEVTTHGATFTIRKFSEVPITPVDLINWNTFSAEEMAYLWLCIENNKSLIYAGGTASGKTSSLNAVSLFIPWQAKIISLEDTRELKLPHPNWIPGITRDSFTADGRGSIDMYDLLRAALRQRPEYLLVGEVRGKEALTLFQAMSTGHTTFSTMHADSVSSAIHRLENPPISVPRSMIQALNIISIQSQTFVKGKRARRNMKLVEITDIDPTTRNIRTNDIFAWDALTDKFNRVGESKALNEIMIRRGWNIGDLKKELSNRQKILEFMVNNKISDFNAIATIIHDYQVTPDKVLKKLNISG
ncbi:MAG: type II/IV secretion system ATPase subunit [Candidatus Methanoperedens sp.]